MSKVLVTDTYLTDIANAIREQNQTSNTYKTSEMASAISSISGNTSMNDEIIEFNQMNDTLTSYLEEANALYTDNNYASISIASNYVSSTPNDDPIGYDISISYDGILHIIDEDQDNMSWQEEVTAGSYTIYHLIPEHIYRWYVISNGITYDNGRLKSTGIVREIYDTNSNTEESDNCRDLGGWNGAAGIVKYGILYRGECPTLLKTDTKNILQNHLYIKSQIDLYASNATGKLWSNIDYNEFPLSDQELLDNVELDNEYCTVMANALIKIMDNAYKEIPTYIHCWAGADRTGIVSWMLHILLGVSIADSDKDYEITNLSGRSGRYRTGFASIINFFFDFGEDTILDNVLYWCGRNGIKASLINKFRNAMLSEVPTDISFNNFINITSTLCSYNGVNTIANGEKLSCNIIPNTETEIFSISIIMNGENISSDCYSIDEDTGYANITIDEVYADVFITAIAVVTTERATIRYNLTNVTSSNTTTKIILGESYETLLITNNSAYSLADVTVIMKDIDITADCFNSNTGIISISEVIGNIVIYASISGYINLVPTAVTWDSDNGCTIILDDCGYRDGAYCSDNSNIDYSSDSSFFATGLMPITINPETWNEAIYIKGFTLTEQTHTRIQFSTSITYLSKGSGTIYNSGQLHGSGSHNISEAFNIETLDADSEYYKLSLKIGDGGTPELYETIGMSSSNYIVGFRLSAPISTNGTENIIITVDEEIL